MLAYPRSTLSEAGPTLKQFWLDMLCSLGFFDAGGGGGGILTRRSEMIPLTSTSDQHKRSAPRMTNPVQRQTEVTVDFFCLCTAT